MKNITMNQVGLFDPTTGAPSLLGLIGAAAPARVEPVALTTPLELAKPLTALERCGVGTIFSHSWGWEQTNIDFYEVVKVGAATLVVREVESTKVRGDMVATETPQPSVFIGPPMRKTPEIYRDTVLIGMKYGSCRLWDGKPEHSSSYA